MSIAPKILVVGDRVEIVYPGYTRRGKSDRGLQGVITHIPHGYVRNWGIRLSDRHVTYSFRSSLKHIPIPKTLRLHL